MNYSIKDLQKLTSSQEYADFKKENQKYIILGEKIYGRRKDLSLTQSKLSELSGVPQNKISQLESGTYGEPGSAIIEKLSSALGISLEYLFYSNISRKTVELLNYILSKLENPADIMQFMKLPYFVDIACREAKIPQISNFQYARWHYGPFDKKVYDYQKLFSCENEKGISDLGYIYLSSQEMEIIDITLAGIPKDDGEQLKKLSYKTYPMQKLGVCIGDGKCMGEMLEL